MVCGGFDEKWERRVDLIKMNRERSCGWRASCRGCESEMRSLAPDDGATGSDGLG